MSRSDSVAETRPVHVELEAPVFPSFRVEAVAGMFDVPIEERARAEFSVELPPDDGDWQIGVIVGASGSGKSSVAREAYGRNLIESMKWPASKAVIDAVAPPDVDTSVVTKMLTAVGFSSPPSWIKPYAVLSNGEKFRCTLARALLLGRPLIAIDEYTSVVDRTVAQIGSAAVQKAIRATPIADGGKRFVAVTCHYDIIDWLCPDWVLDMNRQQLARGSVRRRPSIRLELRRADRHSWRAFARHHYLNHTIHKASRVYVCLWDGVPVGCVVTLMNLGHANYRRVSRIVVLPDYQGIGIGRAMTNMVCEVEHAEGYRMSTKASHAALIHALDQSPRWALANVSRATSKQRNFSKSVTAGARMTATFIYVGTQEENTA